MANFEYKLVKLRECPAPSSMATGDEPSKIAKYYREFIATGERHNADVESFYVVMLNTRRKITGFVFITQGLLDTLLVHAREVFKAAIVANASAVVLMHNHPSGDSMPSEADIRVTRDLTRAGQLLHIEVLDHIIMGIPDNNTGYTSLRELGYLTL